MQRIKPPFRADHVGSLLRPPALKAARAKRFKNEISAAELKTVEDQEIRKAIRKQEDLGLKVATDGEFRRTYWNLDVFSQLDGVAILPKPGPTDFGGLEARAEGAHVIGRLGTSRRPLAADFTFIRENTRVTPKITIPGPPNLHFRVGRGQISMQHYPDLDEFFSDLSRTWQAFVQVLYDAGCRYLQVDDTFWGYYCSPVEIEEARKRGLDMDKIPALYARVTREAFAKRPRDMVLALHTCRGNFKSHWMSEGGYEPSADYMFNQMDFDAYFLEYDDERSGGFEPLRLFPKGDKQLVLGLITSKFPKLEDKGLVKKRIEQATKYVDINQLCLSPQCGFASTDDGNEITEEQQWAKLRHVVEIADEVWGR